MADLPYICGMKKWGFYCLMCIIALSACAPVAYFGFWQSDKVVADGVAKEWSVPLNYFDSDTKLQYTFSNDRQNIYVCLKTSDEKTQVKIIKGGLQLWIDTNGRNRNHVGIFFPTPSPEPFEKFEKKEGGKTETSIPLTAMKTSFLAAPKDIKLAGFKAPWKGLMTITPSLPIQVALNWDSLKVMVYEAIIPFKTFYKDSLSWSDSSKVFGITVTVNGLKSASNGGGHNTGGDASAPGNIAGAGSGAAPTAPGMGSAMGGRGGAGNRRGAPTNLGPVNPLYENASLKAQIKLATKPKRKFSMVGW